MCWNDSDGVECVGCNSRAVGLNNSVVKVQPDRDKENESVESCPRATGNRHIAHCRVKYRDIGGLVNVVSRQPFFAFFLDSHCDLAWPLASPLHPLPLRFLILLGFIFRASFAF